MRQMLSKPKQPSPQMFTDYSQHALGCAIMTQFLAHYTRSQDTEAAFAAGLFHDIGQLLIISTLPDMLPLLIAHWEANNGPFEDSEQALLGVSHPVLSSVVLERWKLPDAIQNAARYHNEPGAAPEEETPVTLSHLVHAADVYVKSYGLQVIASEKRPPESPEPAFEQIGLRDHLPELLERFKSEFQSIRSAFQ
jgi:HD-like signal output (HDOD) protein